MAVKYSEMSYDEKIVLLVRTFVSDFLSDFEGIMNVLNDEISEPEMYILKDAYDILKMCYSGL